MTRELTGATALVTGASRGFGRAISTALLDAGARVVGVARDRAALQELERLGGRAMSRTWCSRRASAVGWVV